MLDIDESGAQARTRCGLLTCTHQLIAATVIVLTSNLLWLDLLQPY